MCACLFNRLERKLVVYRRFRSGVHLIGLDAICLDIHDTVALNLTGNRIPVESHRAVVHFSDPQVTWRSQRYCRKIDRLMLYIPNREMMIQSFMELHFSCALVNSILVLYFILICIGNNEQILKSKSLKLQAYWQVHFYLPKHR